MGDYSIEASAERIDNAQTRQHFREVLSSYQTGNYRSAVVMLWSVVICDLIYKLLYLRDVDNDTVANDIIVEIENKQKANPKSPEWEIHLLKLISERTELIDSADFTNLTNIQEIRHLSAHPVLSNLDLLFTPHKEQVRSFIRISLESILTKQPVFLRKVVDEFVVDIALKRDILLENKSLKRYIESKYFKRLRPATENHLFKALWKFVFRLENDETNLNREINFRCLLIFFDRRPTELKGLIRDDAAYYSSLGGETTLSYLCRFLSDNPDVFVLLDDSARILIENFATRNLENFAPAIYLSETFDSHLENLLERIELQGTTYTPNGEYIDGESWKSLIDMTHEGKQKATLKEIATSLYTKSGNFMTADYCFENILVPVLNDFDEAELRLLLDGIENNGQVNGRRKAKSDHMKLLEVCKEKLPFTFESSEYPNCFNE